MPDSLNKLVYAGSHLLRPKANHRITSVDMSMYTQLGGGSTCKCQAGAVQPAQQGHAKEDGHKVVVQLACGAAFQGLGLLGGRARA